MSRYLIPSLMQEMRDLFEDVEIPGKRTGVSVYENEGKIFVEAEIPGLKGEEICVNFDKGILTIEAESKEEKKDVKYHIKSEKRFSYRIPLPNRIDENKAPDAVYKDGIITISFVKSKASKATKIAVKTKS